MDPEIVGVLKLIVGIGLGHASNVVLRWLVRVLMTLFFASLVLGVLFEPVVNLDQWGIFAGSMLTLILQMTGEITWRVFEAEPALGVGLIIGLLWSIFQR